jgi:hypothetical protein
VLGKAFTSGNAVNIPQVRRPPPKLDWAHKLTTLPHP